MSDSQRWWSVWAKTDRDPQQPTIVTAWLSLPQHLVDAAGVADHLVTRWVSPQVIRRIAADLDGTAADVRTLAIWLAAVHDVGKISQAFTVQVLKEAPGLLGVMRRNGLAVDSALADDGDRARVRHELVGQDAVWTWLADEMGFNFRVAAAQLGWVVGSHHGVPPTSHDIEMVQGAHALAGRGPWEQQRSVALAWATDLVGGREALKPYADIRLGRPAQALLTAIVIMADWIASNTELFPLDPLPIPGEPLRTPDPARTAERLRTGLARLDLPTPWVPQPVGDARAAFTGRFGREPRPVQVAAVEAALSHERPGMVIVEAPMGEGKTEAALLAAEALAGRTGADGCFVALPTRATTDAMFGRVLRWMRALPGIATDISVTLAHGTASLNDEYRGLLSAGRVQDVGDDEAGSRTTGCAAGRKGPSPSSSSAPWTRCCSPGSRADTSCFATSPWRARS